MDADSRHVPRDKFTAGFRLLDKFEKQWEYLHQRSENNAIKAKQALTKLNQIELSCTRRLDALDQFVDGYNSLSSLDERINNINCDLKSLEQCFIKIEEHLLSLKLTKEKSDADKFVRNVEGNHGAQVQRLKIEAELRKDKLMSEHLLRVQSFENAEQTKLDERRRVLEKEFEEEKSRYLDKSSNKTTT